MQLWHCVLWLLYLRGLFVVGTACTQWQAEAVVAFCRWIFLLRVNNNYLEGDERSQFCQTVSQQESVSFHSQWWLSNRWNSTDKGGQLIQLRGVSSDPDALRNCRALECHIISKLYNMSLNSFAVSKFDGELLASYAFFPPISPSLTNSVTVWNV